MFEKWKNILTEGLLSAFVLGFGIWAAVKPADALSTSERRPLAQMPELSASSYLSGKFMSGYEDYATAQFPLREQFRTLKALMGLYVFGQKDNNGVYLADGSAAKLEYPLNEGSVTHAADRFRYLYETLMAGTDTKVYLSVIPDKNYFLAEANGYPAYDEQALAEKLAGELEYADYIDLHRLGGLVTRTMTVKPRRGAEAPRLWETPSGLLICVGCKTPDMRNSRRYFTRDWWAMTCPLLPASPAHRRRA